MTRYQLQHLGSNKVSVQTAAGLPETSSESCRSIFLATTTPPEVTRAENCPTPQGNALPSRLPRSTLAPRFKAGAERRALPPALHLLRAAAHGPTGRRTAAFPVPSHTSPLGLPLRGTGTTGRRRRPTGTRVSPGRPAVVAEIRGQGESRGGGAGRRGRPGGSGAALPLPAAADILGEARSPPVGEPRDAPAPRARRLLPARVAKARGGMSSSAELPRPTAPTPREARPRAGGVPRARRPVPRPRGAPASSRGSGPQKGRAARAGQGVAGQVWRGGRAAPRAAGPASTHSHSGAGTRPARPPPPPPWRCAGPGLAGSWARLFLFLLLRVLAGEEEPLGPLRAPAASAAAAEAGRQPALRCAALPRGPRPTRAPRFPVSAVRDAQRSSDRSSVTLLRGTQPGTAPSPPPRPPSTLAASRSARRRRSSSALSAGASSAHRAGEAAVGHRPAPRFPAGSALLLRGGSPWRAEPGCAPPRKPLGRGRRGDPPAASAAVRGGAPQERLRQRRRGRRSRPESRTRRVRSSSIAAASPAAR